MPQLAGGLLVAIGADEQDPPAVQLAGGELGESKRIRVGPVQILDHDNHGPGPGQGGKEAGRCGKEPEPGTAGGGARDAGGLGRCCPAQRLNRIRWPGPRLCGGADNLRPWPERRHALGLRAAAPQHQDAPGGRLVGGRRGDGGLADPGLPAD